MRGTVLGTAAAAVLLALLVIGLGGTYTIDEAEQAVVLQFGKPVGDPVTEPGLHFKVPFIQEVRRFEKRLLVWDGAPNQIPTSGREFISVDTTARWRISDPLTFLQSVTNEIGAQSRLDDIIDSVVRDEISGTNLVDIVRSADWEVTDEDLERMEVVGVEGGDKALMAPVQVGRQRLTRRVLTEAQSRTPQYGIEVVDVRLKRLNYIEDVRRQVFSRMTSERERIAEKYRSEGAGEASRIKGETERRLAEISSEAKRKAEIIRGEADAEATRIYSDAYGADPAFYAFSRTLESYQKTLGEETVLVVGLDSPYFEFLRRLEPALPGDADARATPNGPPDGR
jgi:membrane protease subunit HflC